MVGRPHPRSCTDEAQALVGQGGQSRRISFSLRQGLQHPPCTCAEQIRNQTG